MTTPIIPPAHVPPIQGLPNLFSYSWWRFFSQSGSSSEDSIVIANNALTIANSASVLASNASTIAGTAQLTANNAQITADVAEAIGTEALLKPDPLVPDLNQAFLFSLMLS